MQKHTITPRRVGPQHVEPPAAPPDPSSAERPAAAQGRTAWLRHPSRHKVLGTAFLAAKVQKWGRNKVLGCLFLFSCVPPAVGVLLLAAWPYITYGVTAPSSYQPTVLVQVLLAGAPGETESNGLQHLTTLIFTYSDHLTLVEIPAGDARRTSRVDATNFQQHGSHPRILSAHFEPRAGRAHPDLVVRVSMDWQALFSAIFAFDFANHPEYLSTKAGTPGYTAPQFGLVNVTKEP